MLIDNRIFLDVMLYTFLIICISYLQYRCIEKKMSSYPNKSVFITITFLYFFIVFTVLLPRGFGLIDGSNMSVQVKTNLNLIKACEERKRYECESDILFKIKEKRRYSRICMYKGNGTGIILITGKKLLYCTQ